MPGGCFGCCGGSKRREEPYRSSAGPSGSRANSQPQSAKDFKKDILDAHNDYRGKHGAPTMKWSTKLAGNAQKWAEELSRKNYMMHASQKEEGENIACMKGQELTGRKATEMWYDEIKDYNFSKPGFNSQTGHFTQVVWVESHELGVGKATSANGMQFVVARYFPPGNMLGSFPANVKKPGSKVVKRADDSKPSAGAGPRGAGPRGAGAGSGPSGASETSTKPQNSKEFRDDILRSHNQCRKFHKSSALKWSGKLAAEAQKASDEAARTNTLKPVQMKNVGQNMAAMTGGNLTGQKVTEMWYEEEKNYNYASPGFSSSTGSFTQMIWSDTATVGAAKSVGKSGQQFVIALYEPPGNVRGQYEQNIKQSSGRPKGKDGKDCSIM